MKTDKFYYLIQIKQEDKYYAYVFKSNDSLNLYSQIKGLETYCKQNNQEIVSINPIKTFKHARRVVDVWTKQWKEEDRYLYPF